MIASRLQILRWSLFVKTACRKMAAQFEMAED
jgi:hypothetical protein